MTLRLQRKINILLGAALLLGSVFSGEVFAQEDTLGFSVSPVIFDMTANRDQVWKSNIKVINANSYELRLNARVVGFEPQNESGVPSFLELDPNDSASLASWMSVPEVVVVPPESTIEVPVVIYVPPEADPGGHFAAVLIGSDTNQSGPESDAPQVSTSQVISSLFFLSVAGDITESARIRSFRAVDYLLSEPTGTFELRLENEGNVHLQPTGEIIITNMWGQVRGKIPINKEAQFGKILPNSIRKYSYDWSSEWSVADIGWYRANAVLSYGATNRQSLTAETSFLVLPIGWVLLTLLGIFAIFYLFITIVKLYVRRTLALSGYRPAEETAVPLTKTERRLDFVAPLETGFLDLRENISNKVNLKEWFSGLLHFIEMYKRFFMYVALVLVVIIITIWYVSSATSERNYTVISETGEVTTNQTAEEVESIPSPQSSSQVPITLVDRTGQPVETSQIIGRLANEGFVVVDRMSEQVEDQTVVVYSKDRTREAVQLSRILGEALLSALPEESEDNQILVFLGTDQLTSGVE